jgi:selenocysteine lyase/cysteine desulfurase
MRPLRHLERTLDLALQEIPTAAEGPLDLAWLDATIENEGVRLVAVLDASNVTGEIMPIRDVGEICRRRGAYLLVDAAQGGGLLVHDVEGSGVDALVLTGHKGLLGPPGTGAVYLRQPESVEPLIRGGTGSRSDEEKQPGFLPDRYEAGTANVPGVAGLAEGVRYLRRRGLKAIRSRVGELTALLIEGLASIRRVKIHGPLDPARRVGVVSFTVEGLSTSDAARALEEHGILCRPGLHCAPRAHRTLGTTPQGTVRFSLSSFTTEEEIRRAVEAVRRVTGSH